MLVVLTLILLFIGGLVTTYRVLTRVGALVELVVLGLFFRDLNPPAGSVGAIAEPRWDIFLPGIGASTLILVASLFTGQDRGRRAFMLIVNLAVLVQGVLGGARVHAVKVEDS